MLVLRTALLGGYVDWKALGWVALAVVLAVLWLAKVWLTPGDEDDPL